MGRVGRVYRKFRSKFFDSPTFFSWVVDGKLAASGMPFSGGQVAWLSSRGINRILSLTEKPLPEDWFRHTGISVKHVPMRDHEPPDMEKLKEATSYIQSEIGSKGVVLVHCLAGKGRTGTAVAAYLVAFGEMDAAGAIKHIRELRPGSVESRQEDAVLEFERTVKRDSRLPR